MAAHHNLAEIFFYLWEMQIAPRGSFIDQVFRLVLFQDSVESLAQCPSMNNLSPKEKAKYCDNQFYKLMRVLLIADNEAYILFDEVEVRRCRKEIMDLYARMKQQGSRRGDARDTASDSDGAAEGGEHASL